MSTVFTVSPSFEKLHNLTQAVLAHYDDAPLPDGIRTMLPCVQYALDEHDDEFLELMHGYFSIVVEEEGLCGKDSSCSA